MSRENTEETYIKRMADLLRQGSTLTDLACPVCASPLFKLKSGDLWCAKCEKKVIVVKGGEEPAKVTSSMVLETLETTILSKVQEIQNKMQREENVDELQKLSKTLAELLENLEKIRRTKKA
ncbi:MAG: Sjogren's syndrome/scleroderma autoantigen 1 family protein [Candidatus Bathyarchaeia archaeon]